MKNFLNLKSSWTLLLASAASFILISTPTYAQNMHNEFLRASLSPFNQVPAILTQSSGQFEARVNQDGTISFTLSYANMSSAVTQAHIHFGASLTNGGVMVFLCGGPKPACPASGAISGTLTAADVSILPATNADSVIPQGIEPNDLAAVLSAIRSGNTYVNVHTANFPNGELRGQVQAR